MYVTDGPGSTSVVVNITKKIKLKPKRPKKKKDKVVGFTVENDNHNNNNNNNNNNSKANDRYPTRPQESLSLLPPIIFTTALRLKVDVAL